MINRISKTKYSLVLTVLALILLFSIGLFSTIGSANISIIDTFKIIFSKIPFLKNVVDISHLNSAQKSIIWNIRLPRVLLGVLVGASLSLTGASFQGMFNNPMADPYIIGISSGAALGATVAIILKLDFKIFNFSSISIFAFLGGILAVVLVYNIARIKNQVPVVTLLLSGVAIGQFFTAVMSFLMVIFSKDMSKIVYWTLGSLAGKGWNPIITLSIPILVSMFLINIFARDLNIMLTGDESAESLGINVERTKVYILLLGTFMTSVVVSVSGIIGFVGLIIPHIVRILLGPDHRILLPASAFMGGIFMIFADTLARMIISPVEIPVGIITALFGGPFFIYLLRKKKRNL
ncbi:FecCD family ABC transporter permease [Paratissierella segnis]|jgi:iron complex transport system permease protein|uniref:Iron chelate uptake ABC transporter family permease subunit n=1 Tax=Paratissierella segnis TaxID=2763679 RepID=A0A926EX64_9FIRM|nr:iron chelate uptake ABC transporter family permease subunit [Paratissierella segnis]MBC8589187.1 iron chelate uptake ABC transporter family permease subunit [Paratissierella segnis]